MLICGNTFVTLHSFTAQNSVEIYIFENISFSDRTMRIKTVCSSRLTLNFLMRSILVHRFHTT